MSDNVTLRLAERSDIPTLARMANAGNAQSVLHRRMAPHQDQYPPDYYQWRLKIVRLRFATPNLRTIVAVDSSSGEILGQASWAVEGADTNLYKEWVCKSTWADWLEARLIGAEQTWCRYFADKSIDYNFFNDFWTAFQGNEQLARPACLHCHMIVVDPSAQSRGVGGKLIDWAKQLAVRNGLPLYLEGLIEAKRFYEKGGFSRLYKDFVIKPDGPEPICVPVFVWEGKEREGRWLEAAGSVDREGERWMWKEEGGVVTMKPFISSEQSSFALD